MLGLKGTLIAGVLGIAVSLGLAFLWKNEQVKGARLEAELDASVRNAETLKAALNEQMASVNSIIELARTNQEQVNELTQQLAAARAETDQVRQRINALRAAEANRALEAPFERGNVAHERFSDSLRRISGKTGGESPDSDGAEAAGTGNAP